MAKQAKTSKPSSGGPPPPSNHQPEGESHWQTLAKILGAVAAILGALALILANADKLIESLPSRATPTTTISVEHCQGYAVSNVVEVDSENIALHLKPNPDDPAYLIGGFWIKEQAQIVGMIALGYDRNADRFDISDVMDQNCNWAPQKADPILLENGETFELVISARRYMIRLTYQEGETWVDFASER